MYVGLCFYNDNNIIVKLIVRFEFEKLLSVEEKIGDIFLGNDIIEGLVGILGGFFKSS